MWQPLGSTQLGIFLTFFNPPWNLNFIQTLPHLRRPRGLSERFFGLLVAKKTRWSIVIHALGIQSPKLRMVSWKLNTFLRRFFFTPLAHHLRRWARILRDGAEINPTKNGREGNENSDFFKDVISKNPYKWTYVTLALLLTGPTSWPKQIVITGSSHLIFLYIRCPWV